MANITQVRDQFRNVVISITGVAANSNSPVFHSFGYPIGSFAMSGVLDTTTPPTAMSLQGSNDGGTTWYLVGSTFTGLSTGSMVGTNNEVFQSYRFNITGGDAGTNLNFYVFLSATFG